VYLEHGGTRNIDFVLENTTYEFDPNRMFTPAGIRTSLLPFNETAAAFVAEFAQVVLDVYGFDNVSQVIALHNNGGTYGAEDYLRTVIELIDSIRSIDSIRFVD